MRVGGDPEACAALGRELARAAYQVGQAGAVPEHSLLPAFLWSGLAAGRWRQATSRRGERAARLADRLSAAARSVDRFAGQLEQLQGRAAALAATAAAEGVPMDAAGHLAPVLLPVGPFVAPEALAEQQRAQHRAEVRERLVHQVAALRADEDAAHRGLIALLRAVAEIGLVLHAEPPPTAAPDHAAEPSRWAPSASDWTSVFALVATRPLSSLPGLPPARVVRGALRTVPAVVVVSAGFGVREDMDDGYSYRGAVVKQAVVTSASAGAGVAVGSALGLGAVGAVGVVATAPLSLGAVAAFGVAAGVSMGVGYVGSRLWSMAFPAEQQSPPVRQRAPERHPRPRPDARTRPQPVAPLLPDCRPSRTLQLRPAGCWELGPVR